MRARRCCSACSRCRHAAAGVRDVARTQLRTRTVRSCAASVCRRSSSADVSGCSSASSSRRSAACSAPLSSQKRRRRRRARHPMPPAESGRVQLVMTPAHCGPSRPTCAWDISFGQPWPTKDRTPRFDDLLREDRTFPPPAEFRARAACATRRIYAEAERDPEAFWAQLRRRARVVAPLGHGARLAAAAREVVRRRHSSTPASTASTATSRGPRRNKAALIWEGEPGDRRTLTYFDLYREVSTVRQRAEVARRQEGRPRRDLPAARSPSWRSRCSPARASAPSTASCSAASAPSRCAIASTTRRPGCSSPPTAAIAAARSSPLKQIADEALADTPSIEHVVVVQRGGGASMPVHDARKGAITGITS